MLRVASLNLYLFGLALLLVTVPVYSQETLRRDAEECSFITAPVVEDVTTTSATIAWHAQQNCSYFVALVPEGATCSCPGSVGPCTDPEAAWLTHLSPRSIAVYDAQAVNPNASTAYRAPFDTLSPGITYRYVVGLLGQEEPQTGHFHTALDDGVPIGYSERDAKDARPDSAYRIMPFLQNMLGRNVSIVSQTREHQPMYGALAVPYGTNCPAFSGPIPPILFDSDAVLPHAEADTLNPQHVYQPTLEGLVPDYKYWYWMILEGEDQIVGGHDYNFINLAEGGDTFAFYVYGDNRTDVEQHRAVVKAMQTDLYSKTNTDAAVPFPRFLVSTGDYSKFACYQEGWLDEYFGPAQPLLKNLPMLTTPGNHEFWLPNVCPRSGYFESYFIDPPNAVQRPDTLVADTLGFHNFDYFITRKMYTFDYANSRFLSMTFLFSSLLEDTGGIDKPPLAEYLNKALTDTDGIDHIFPFYHAPMLAQVVPDSDGHTGSAWQVEHLSPRLQGLGRGKVAAVFTGHNHFYERSKSLLNVCPSTDSTNPYGVDCTDVNPACGKKGYSTSMDLVCKYDLTHTSGITYVISGGGGAPLYPVPTPYSNFDGWMGAAESTLEFVLVTVKGARVTAVTYDSTNESIDPFIIRSGRGNR